MKRMKFLMLLVVALMVQGVQAQNPEKGLISGKLVEADTKEALGFASVGLFASSDSSLVRGATSTENGQFSLENLPF